MIYPPKLVFGPVHLAGATKDPLIQEYAHIISFWTKERELIARLQKQGGCLPEKFRRWPNYFPDSAIYLCELSRFVHRSDLVIARAA